MYLWMLGAPQRGCLFIVAARYYGGAILEIHLPISPALHISHYRWPFLFFLFQPRFRSIIVFTHCCSHRDHDRSQFSSMITDHADFFLEKRWTDLKISLKDPRDLIERILRNKSTQIRKVQLIFFFSKLGNQKDPRLEISRLTFVGKFSNFPLNISLSFFPPRLTIRLHVRIYSS